MPAPVIIVMGASRGIGRAFAEESQSRGADDVGAARDVEYVPATASLLPVAADVIEVTGRKAILERVLEINLLATFALCCAAYPRLKASRPSSGRSSTRSAGPASRGTRTR